MVGGVYQDQYSNYWQVSCGYDWTGTVLVALFDPFSGKSLTLVADSTMALVESVPMLREYMLAVRDVLKDLAALRILSQGVHRAEALELGDASK